MERKNVWTKYTEAELKELNCVNELYKACLDAGKTERECVKIAVQMAEEKGYKDLNDFIKTGTPLKNLLNNLIVSQIHIL